MRIAVTGALGWVGRAVVEYAIDEGHDVVAIDRAGHDAGASRPVVPVDASDYPSLAEALVGCDALIHLAAINGPGREPDHIVHNNNVVSSYNALRAAAGAGVTRISQASSVNAIGGRFSQNPNYDYLPLDEEHPAYPEDPYSLSKWICEQQADAISRRHRDISIASLRLHGVVDAKADTASWLDAPGRIAVKQLWGYTLRSAAARAFVLGVTADFSGHEVFYVVAPETMAETTSAELHAAHYSHVPLRHPLEADMGFFDCAKAQRLLGWSHDAD